MTQTQNLNPTTWLVVFQNNNHSITTASFDQYTAQQLCHRYAKVTGIAHAVVKEMWRDLPLSVRVELRKQARVERERKQIMYN